MTNHVHLLLTPSATDALSALMRNLGQRYVQYVNRTYGRTGTLWEGRFRSCLVQSPRYVLACHRYIELNPVRARLVEDPADYRWSSYGANACGLDDRLVTPHLEFIALGNDAPSRRRAYRNLLQDPLEQLLTRAIREATNGGYPLGSESFKRDIVLRPGQRLAPGPSGRPTTRSNKSYRPD